MARAGGKAILLGEHAVVYGIPALVVGLNRGVEAVARRPRNGMRSLRIGDMSPVSPDDDSILGKAFGALLEACSLDAPVVLEATSALPIGAGVGSSAALGVACARALAETFALPTSPELEQQRALAWERIFHGNPSGIDTAAAALGGCLFYTRGAPPEPLRLRRGFSVVLAFSGQSSDTKKMVDGIAKLREQKRALFEKQLDSIRSLVMNARLALEAGDLVGLGKLMDLNQMILSAWMLSTQEIEELCAIARDAGALGAKLTGAGGGGCVVALCDGSPKVILEAWERAGYQGFASPVGASLPDPFP
ncbi:MAG: mevalonate kinase [Myxococcales bacterium]|nr:mevalonate kinase [Polyangiaceae bacterium]MDW8251289.1 mevalonate kinase [Myxococcales bacterium]